MIKMKYKIDVGIYDRYESYKFDYIN